MNEDKETISNEEHEINYAASYLNVKPFFIHLAKSQVGDNREKVYEWVNTKKSFIKSEKLDYLIVHTEIKDLLK